MFRRRVAMLVALTALPGGLACSVDAEKRDYLESAVFFGGDKEVCNQVKAQGGVEAAAANAHLRVSMDRPDLGITVDDIFNYLDSVC